MKEDIKVEDLIEVKVNDLYSISVPDYMKEMKSLNDDASFSYANIFKETYIIVINESKEEFINTFIENKLYDNSKTALENYVDFQLENYQKSIKDIEIKQLKSKINTTNSKQYQFNGKVDNLDIVYLISFVEGENNMYLMMSWTLKDRYTKYKKTFKIIQNSFKILK
jgi:hypothetical protein